jgi:hypothetical protein
VILIGWVVWYQYRILVILNNTTNTKPTQEFKQTTQRIKNLVSLKLQTTTNTTVILDGIQGGCTLWYWLVKVKDTIDVASTSRWWRTDCKVETPIHYISLCKSQLFHWIQTCMCFGMQLQDVVSIFRCCYINTKTFFLLSWNNSKTRIGYLLFLQRV